MMRRVGRKANNLDDFFEAVFESDEETARQLLQSSPNIRNSYGLTLIDQAVLLSNLNKLHQFIALGCDINLMTNGQTPLFAAIKLCKVDIAQILLEAHADVNIKSACVLNDEIADGSGNPESTDPHHGLSPIYLAIRFNDTAMVELLVKYGSILDEPSLLHGAIRTGNPELLGKLLAAGANVDRVDHKDWTPLATAIINEEPAMIKLLLEHGADVHKTIPFLVFQNSNKLFFSPLLLSTIFDVTLIPMLLSFGANPCAGRIPHGTAERMDLQRCMAPLCSNLGRDTNSLRYFLTANCPLIWPPGDHGPEEDDIPSNSLHQHDSALYMAIYKKSKASVELLLNCGFDIASCCAPTKELVREVVDQNKSKEMTYLLKCSLVAPLTLLSLCRNTIRCSIGRGITDKVNSVRLPQALINYVLLQDVFVV